MSKPEPVRMWAIQRPGGMRSLGRTALEAWQYECNIGGCSVKAFNEAIAGARAAGYRAVRVEVRIMEDE